MVRLNVGWLGIAGGSVEGSGFATGSVSDAIDKGLPRLVFLGGLACADPG
ncbi:hypothetical protein ABIA31_004613 [Catenulispora sp. MAP5-51]